MARRSWLHSSSISDALLPILFRRTTTATLHSTFIWVDHFSSTTRFNTSLNRLRLRLMTTIAQAKRSVLFKDDEVASPGDLQFESPLKIVEYPDLILRAKNKRIEAFDESLKK